ncbi:unnamed protein product [Larinioides sclopetarius]|uniref:Sulfotransferase domain-containing protein n=1 Tax=Larinioides sclopetarius TaxID=280406 RepID=A0AAV1ZBC2_9ARAC
MPPSSEEKNQNYKKPTYKEIDGFRIPVAFSEEAYRSALAYQPRPDDLFIVTYPKCGTTWVQNLVACIFREGKPFSSGLELFMQAPFLELTGAEGAEKMKRPGSIKVHLPFERTPYSPEAKYIFVARNPKRKLEKDPELLQNVIRHSSFGFMNEYLDKHLNEMLTLPKEQIRNNPDIPSGLKAVLLWIPDDILKRNKKPTSLIRKGIIGDWRNYFSPTQSTRMDQKLKEKFAGTGLLDLWKDEI